MTAKEMFKELEYECDIDEDEDIIEYHKLTLFGAPYDEIRFNLKWRNIDVFKNRYSYAQIDNLLLKAMYQQAKELGWLE